MKSVRKVEYKNLSLLCVAILTSLSLLGQVKRVADSSCDFSKSKLNATSLFSDSLSSSFKICIDDEVKSHYHQHHTEHVYVLSGKGEMVLGDSLFTIEPGQLIFIPATTIHSVKKTSIEPLEVISIQSPRFDGTDRIFVPK